MSWITLTSDDVKAAISAPEISGITNAAKQSSQTPESLIAAAIGKVTQRVRSRVSACEKNVLGPEGTIPDELEDAALTLVLERLFTRLPGMKGLWDEIRQDSARDARSQLDKAAACKIAIVPPESPAADNQQPGSPTPSIKARDRKFSREDQDGI